MYKIEVWDYHPLVPHSRCHEFQNVTSVRLVENCGLLEINRHDQTIVFRLENVFRYEVVDLK
ncbi:MAG: hypothetical protein GQ553_03735 [Nitrosomonadaceae bacterium]|nr:hypothetical protein [Nitrosomonadaceae bacterium]